MNFTPTIRNANLLYVVSALLIITLGARLQNWEIGTGLVLTEVICILMPTLLLLRRRPWPETLAWRPAPLPATLLAIPIGLGTWALGALLTSVMILITGYQAPAPAAPGSLVGAIAFALGLVLFAPLCEEVLFRGYIFKAYSARGARVAVVGSALLFAFFHLRLQGLPGLLPAAFAFGIIRWRTGSLRPGMVAHAAHNAMAAALLLLPALGVSLPMELVALSIPVFSLVGIGAFVVLIRKSVAPEIPVTAEPAPIFKRYWPLLPFAALYLHVAIAEAGGLPAGAVPQNPPPLQVAAHDRPQTWRYEIRNVDDKPVGTMECGLTPETDSLTIRCEASNRSWRVERSGTLYMSDASQSLMQMRWSRVDLRLLELSSRIEFIDVGAIAEVQVKREGDGLRLTVSGGGPEPQQLDLPPGAMLAEEWVWRLALAEMEATTEPVALASPYKWSPKLMQSVPVVEAVGLTVTAADGEWAASLGERLKAWYGLEVPHQLLRWDTGLGTSYVLIQE